MTSSKNNEASISSDQRERCVLCGAETEYVYSTPINERRGYVRAVGQLCENCARQFALDNEE